MLYRNSVNSEKSNCALILSFKHIILNKTILKKKQEDSSKYKGDNENKDGTISWLKERNK